MHGPTCCIGMQRKQGQTPKHGSCSAALGTYVSSAYQARPTTSTASTQQPCWALTGRMQQRQHVLPRTKGVAHNALHGCHTNTASKWCFCGVCWVAAFSTELLDQPSSVLPVRWQHVSVLPACCRCSTPRSLLLWPCSCCCGSTKHGGWPKVRHALRRVPHAAIML
jgi:hypothetical protein